MEWFAIGGAALVGILVPEYIGALAKVQVPISHNLLMSIGFAMTAGYFAFK